MKTQLTGLPGIAFYGLASAWNWIGANGTLLCALIFLVMAWRDDGLFTMLWLGFALILQGQYWMHKDIERLRGEKNASVSHK